MTDEHSFEQLQIVDPSDYTAPFGVAELHRLLLGSSIENHEDFTFEDLENGLEISRRMEDFYVGSEYPDIEITECISMYVNMAWGLREYTDRQEEELVGRGYSLLFNAVTNTVHPLSKPVVHALLQEGAIALHLEHLERMSPDNKVQLEELPKEVHMYFSFMGVEPELKDKMLSLIHFESLGTKKQRLEPVRQRIHFYQGLQDTLTALTEIVTHSDDDIDALKELLEKSNIPLEMMPPPVENPSDVINTLYRVLGITAFGNYNSFSLMRLYEKITDQDSNRRPFKTLLMRSPTDHNGALYSGGIVSENLAVSVQNGVMTAEVSSTKDIFRIMQRAIRINRGVPFESIILSAHGGNGIVQLDARTKASLTSVDVRKHSKLITKLLEKTLSPDGTVHIASCEAAQKRNPKGVAFTLWRRTGKHTTGSRVATPCILEQPAEGGIKVNYVSGGKNLRKK